MRDPGLSEAIRAVGGVTELARQHRHFAAVRLQLDARSGRARAYGRGGDRRRRAVLRPDLYGAKAETGDVDEVDLARAQEYALLAALLARAPDAAMLQTLAELRGDPTARSGLPMSRWPRPPAGPRLRAVEREFFNLFIGIGRGELLPYGSYYLSGFLQERPLARLRDDLATIGIARSRRRGGAGGSRRHSVRDHVRDRQPAAAGAARVPTA